MSAKAREHLTRQDIEQMSDKEVRSLYTELRDIAHKRAGRVRAAGLSDSEPYASQEFPRLRDMTIDEARDQLLELNKFVRNKKGTTVRGIRETRKKQLRSLRGEIPIGGETGDTTRLYDIDIDQAASEDVPFQFVNEENLADFGRFMDRSRYYAYDHKLPDSDIAARIYNEAQRLGISSRVLETKFRVFQASEEEKYRLYNTLASMELPEGRKRLTAAEVMERMSEL